MKEAAFLVFPSTWYEGLPTVIIEAFACGLPVVASELGGTASLLEPGITGLYFEAGNSVQLKEKVRQLDEQPSTLKEMRHAARQRYENSYTPETNYEQLIRLYKGVLAGRADLHKV